MNKVIYSTVAVILISSIVMAQTPQSPAKAELQPEMFKISMTGSPIGVAWGMIYGFPLAKPAEFMSQVRELGAGFTKVNLFWSQLEPEKGKYNWAALDPYLEQLHSPEEGILALFSSSLWGTRTSGWAFPPSPAKDSGDYYRFVHDVVVHTRGRVRYFQTDSEPNNAMFWAGTKEEYVAQLRIFYKAVKDADPKAVVVLGGCDGLFDPGGTHSIPGQEKSLEFFDFVLKEASASFDVFDLHLYADPYTIPARTAYMRSRMKTFGYSRPIICTEYNGPGFFEFPANRRYFGLLQTWSQAIASGEAGKNPADGSISNGITALYNQGPSLAPETQMFLIGPPEALDRKLERIQARDLVIRNILAFSAGVQKTAFWDLWHDTSKRDEMQTLMYGKLKLIELENGLLKKRYPSADVIRRLASELDGMESVRRINVPGSQSTYLFEVIRRNRGSLYVAWDKRDVFSGEDLPDVALEFELKAKQLKVWDAFGHLLPANLERGRLRVQLSITPIFIEALQ